MTGRSSQVARGLNTIAANIVKNQDALAAYGISVEDANGNLKSTFDVLSELKPKWDEMSDSEKVALGTTLAGKNQYKVLASVMQNFAHATDATATALNSSGSAAKENAKYMESIQAKVNAVSAAFQKMSTAVVDSDLVKGILDIVKAMAEFGSTDFGSAVTQFVLLSSISWGGLQLLGQSIIPTVLAQLGAAPSVIEAVGVAINSSLPVILAVTAAIVGLIAVIKAIKEARAKNNPSVEEAGLAMKNTQESLKQVETEYENAKAKLDELNQTKFEDRTSEIQNEIDKLDALVKYYEVLEKKKAEEAKAAAATYAKAVEQNGISMGWQVSMPFFTGEVDDQGLRIVEEYVAVFEDYETAVYAAAAVSAQFNNQIVDLTNVEDAGKELARYGATFTELSISTQEISNELSNFNNIIDSGEELTVSQIDRYKDLIDFGSQYAEALEIMETNGMKLNDGQKEFLSVFEEVSTAYENYIELQAQAQGITKEDIETRYEAASALSAYAQELINASNAYQIFKDKLSETGDYDDAFKGMASLWGEINGEMEKGQYGSQAMITALELLTGQTFDYNSALEYLNANEATLTTLFGDAESGGLGLITMMQQLQESGDDSWGSIQEVNGQLEVSISSFSALANALGISESSLYTLTEAARIFGVDFEYNVQEVLETIDGLNAGSTDLENNIVSLQDGITHVDFEAFVKQAQSLGMTNEEIETYKNLLEHAADTKLDNVDAGLSLLNTTAEDGTEEVEDLDSAINSLGNADASGAASSISSIGDAAKDAMGKVVALTMAIQGLGGVGATAEGTSYAKEGASLVNEEGPELIQSGDKAYIAGGGYPTVTQLHEGDRVYTAEETKDILGNGKLNGIIQAHFGGTGKAKIGIGGASGIVGQSVLDGLNKVKNNGSSSSSSSSSKSSSTPAATEQDIKKEFEAWLKAKKHALAMDEITEEEYYRELEKMNDKYFKGKQEYQDEYWKYQEQIYSWEKKQEEERIKAAEKAAEEAKKAYENEFASWLKAQDHALAMDEITQEEYYEALEAMNDQYFKDKEEYQEKYWQYEEKIYAWRKKQEEEEAKAQEQALKDQIALEKKLNDLAKAKASRVKVFQDGQFRYVSDRDALAKAQEALSGYASGTYSASGGLSLVGENGAEMRVLNKGDGILPSNITKNLWAWGSIDPSSFNGNGSDIYNFDINNLSLPDVQDANGFVTGLKSYALQYAMQRGK